MRLLSAFLLASLVGCSSYDLKSDVSYDQTNVPYGVFDWYRPTNLLGSPIEVGPKGLPCVVYVHGGGWMMGDKSAGKKFADKVCSHGYAVVSPNYHLTGDLTMPDGTVVAGKPWPIQFENLKTFLIYLRANAAQFGIDPDRIASVGVSAGGHLAQMLHLRDPSIRTVTGCDLDGETDLTQPGDQVMDNFDDIMTKAMGHAKPWTLAELTDISTLPLVTKDSKLFILHGERDTNIFVKQADLLAAKCQAVGCDYDYVRLPGARGECHGNCLDDCQAFERFIKWLDRHLK